MALKPLAQCLTQKKHLKTLAPLLNSDMVDSIVVALSCLQTAR